MNLIRILQRFECIAFRKVSEYFTRIRITNAICTVPNIFFSHRRVDLYENGQWLDNLIEHPRKSDIPL